MNVLLIYPEFEHGYRSRTSSRSCYRLGFVDSGRYHYWKLLLWTQFRRPRLMTEAVVLAIYGHHFRKVCEGHVT